MHACACAHTPWFVRACVYVLTHRGMHTSTCDVCIWRYMVCVCTRMFICARVCACVQGVMKLRTQAEARRWRCEKIRRKPEPSYKRLIP